MIVLEKRSNFAVKLIVQYESIQSKQSYFNHFCFITSTVTTTLLLPASEILSPKERVELESELFKERQSKRCFLGHVARDSNERELA